MLRYCFARSISPYPRKLAVIGHQHAEQIGEVLEHGLGAPRVLAYQAQHGVDAVEQKVRADARLQRLQPRLGQRRRQRAAAQIEIADQNAGHEHGENPVALERAHAREHAQPEK